MPTPLNTPLDTGLTHMLTRSQAVARIADRTASQQTRPIYRN